MKTWPWLVGAALLLMARRPVTVAVEDAAQGVIAVTTQNAIANERKFAPFIAVAEQKYGIPTGMLLRLIRQESHFRTDIISGTKVSPVGALGIAQFMPATAKEMNVNPLDPIASIDAAARYLVKIKGWVGGDWTKAVAAYNWGAGNVNKAAKAYGNAWLARAPAETQNYVRAIV